MVFGTNYAFIVDSNGGWIKIWYGHLTSFAWYELKIGHVSSNMETEYIGGFGLGYLPYWLIAVGLGLLILALTPRRFFF
jgi:hypothetical protein